MSPGIVPRLPLFTRGLALMNRAKPNKSNAVPIVGTEERKFGSHDFYFVRFCSQKRRKSGEIVSLARCVLR
jgi:hypothetical protein